MSILVTDVVMVFLSLICSCLSIVYFNQVNVGWGKVYLIIVGKFTKLSKISFSMQCFTADFCSWFSQHKYQNLTFGWLTGCVLSNPSISGIFLKLPHFLRSCFKLFGNSGGNTYIHLLVKIIYFRFTTVFYVGSTSAGKYLFKVADKTGG